MSVTYSSINSMHSQVVERYFQHTSINSDMLSHPDRFHLSSLLSPPPPDVSCFPQCIYPCVFCASSSSMFQENPCFFHCTPAFAILFFLVLLVLTLACSRLCIRLPDHSACLGHEPFCHPVPPGLLVLTFCLSMTILLPTPFRLLNIIRLQPSASCFCIWVSS